MVSWLQEAIRDMFGWFLVVVGTLLLGFCAGYWIGHRQVFGFERMLDRILVVPFLWLGFKEIVIAYVVTGLAWYLPMRFDLNALRLTAAVTNFVVWLVVIWHIVVRTANDKFLAF